MTGENWVLLAAIAAYAAVQLARILAAYRSGKRRDEIKAGRTA